MRQIVQFDEVWQTVCRIYPRLKFTLYIWVICEDKIKNLKISVFFLSDIDECETSCKQRGMVCKNLIGEYSCSCQDGLEMVNGYCLGLLSFKYFVFPRLH